MHQQKASPRPLRDSVCTHTHMLCTPTWTFLTCSQSTPNTAAAVPASCPAPALSCLLPPFCPFPKGMLGWVDTCLPSEEDKCSQGTFGHTHHVPTTLAPA